MAKLDESDKRFLGCLRNIVIGAVVMFLLPYIGICIWTMIDSIKDKKNQERLQLVEECIENLDFVQARKLLSEYSGNTQNTYGKPNYYALTKKKLSQAHVSYLVSQGQFSLAKQIATEDRDKNLYESALMNQLIDIYGSYTNVELIKALSLVEIDVEDDEKYDEKIGKFVPYVNIEEYNMRVTSFNTKLDRFCKSLYAMGKKEDVKAFLNLLKPDYNGSTSKINKIKSQYR